MSKNAIELREVRFSNGKELYISEFLHTMMREPGTVTPGGRVLKGEWVLRDASGTLIDWDQYRNDLIEAHNFKLIAQK